MRLNRTKSMIDYHILDMLKEFKMTKVEQVKNDLKNNHGKKSLMRKETCNIDDNTAKRISIENIDIILYK